MGIAYNIEHKGITLNPKYVFNNISLFFACLILDDGKEQVKIDTMLELPIKELERIEKNYMYI